jgi:hypothetical protein
MPQDKPCHNACEANYNECLNCCYAGGSPSKCTPQPPPVKSNLYALANALNVSAEIGYTGSLYGMLRARASSVGPWEKFDILDLGYPTVAIRGVNGLYVSAEVGYSRTDPLYGMLRARASTIGPWEQYKLGDSFQYGSGDVKYTIKAVNGLYVSTELGYTGNEYAMLRARASSAGPWEQYFWFTDPR